MTKNILERICGSIAEVLTSHIKESFDCSVLEADVRFHNELNSLFPEPTSCEPEPPKPKKKRNRSNKNHKTPLERPELTPQEVANVFFEINGHVYRRTRTRYGAVANSEAGTQNNGRACVLSWNGYRYPRAHIVFVLHTGRWPRYKIFHKNYDRSDDRYENLLESTHSEICRSMCVSNRNLTGVKGVSIDKSYATPRYRSSIMRNGVSIKLGAFATPSEAHAAYARAAKDLHGFWNPASRLYNDKGTESNE